MKKFILIVLTVILVGITVAYFALRSSISTYVETTLITALQTSGIRASASGTQVGITGAEMTSLELFFPQIVSLVKMNDIQLDWNLLKFITMKPTVDLSFGAYDGRMRGSVSCDRTGSRCETNITAQDLQLGLIDPIRSFGISQGAFSITTLVGVMENGLISRGQLIATVKNLSKPTVSTLNIPVQGGMMPFEVPALMSLNATLQAALDNGRVSLNGTQAESSWLDARVHGDIAVDQTLRAQKLAVEMNVVLTDEGQQFLRPYLTLASKGTLPDSTSEFTVKVSGDARRPLIQYLPVR